MDCVFILAFFSKPVVLIVSLSLKIIFQCMSVENVESSMLEHVHTIFFTATWQGEWQAIKNLILIE